MTPTKELQAQEYGVTRLQERVSKRVVSPREYLNRALFYFDDMEQAYLDGYTACEQSMWRSVEDELPEDGDYLTLIRYDSRLIMEIAPWRGGLYQGAYTLSAYTGKASVTHWMPTPILPSLPDTNTK